MKINLFKHSQLEEDYIDIHYIEETSRIKDIVKYIKSNSHELFGYLEGQLFKIPLSEVLYFEAIEHKCFACTLNKVYEIEFTLKQLTQSFEELGFIRINKSTIVNIYKVDSLKNDFEMRVLIKLCNGESLIINRSYKKSFKSALQHIKEKLLEENL